MKRIVIVLGQRRIAHVLAALEAGLTVMAIGRAMREATPVDCAKMWADYDGAFADSVLK
jgi:hypothetical protein